MESDGSRWDSVPQAWDAKKGGYCVLYYAADVEGLQLMRATQPYVTTRQTSPYLL